MIYYIIFRAETANAKLQVDKVASERDVLKSKNESLEAMETELTDQVCYLFIYLINHCIWWFSVEVCKI